MSQKNTRTKKSFVKGRTSTNERKRRTRVVQIPLSYDRQKQLKRKKQEKSNFLNIQLFAYVLLFFMVFFAVIAVNKNLLFTDTQKYVFFAYVFFVFLINLKPLLRVHREALGIILTTKKDYSTTKNKYYLLFFTLLNIISLFAFIYFFSQKANIPFEEIIRII